MSTFYAVHFAPGSPLIEDAEVVDELPHGWALLDSAIALWRLADSERANAIEAFVRRVAEANETYTQFAGDDLAKLIELTTGSEEAIRAAGIIDVNGRVPPERLDELKRKVPQQPGRNRSDRRDRWDLFDGARASVIASRSRSATGRRGGP